MGTIELNVGTVKFLATLGIVCSILFFAVMFLGEGGGNDGDENDDDGGGDGGDGD